MEVIKMSKKNKTSKNENNLKSNNSFGCNCHENGYECNCHGHENEHSCKHCNDDNKEEE